MAVGIGEIRANTVSEGQTIITGFRNSSETKNNNTVALDNTRIFDHST